MKKTTWMLIGIALLEIVACGGGESQVQLASIPEQPIVINADIKYWDSHGEEQTIVAPWFKWKPRVRNNTDKVLTVCSFSFEIIATKNGVSTTSTQKLELDDIYYLDEVNPYETKNLKDDAEQEILIYIYSLPEADSFTYTINIKLEGWFGTHDDPIERASASMTVTTQ